MVDWVSAAETAVALKAFFEEGEFVEALSVIGGNHMESASEIIQNLKFAKDRKASINRAVGHLESAQKDFRHLYTHKCHYGKPYIAERYRVDDFKCCCLMAISHRYLGDSWHIIQVWLARAYEAFLCNTSLVPDSDLYVATQWINIFNPFFYYNSIFNDPTDELPSEDKFFEFCDLMLEHCQEFYLFSIDAEIEDIFNTDIIPVKMKDKFKSVGFPISENATIEYHFKIDGEDHLFSKDEIKTEGYSENDIAFLKVLITDGELPSLRHPKKYIIRKEKGKLSVYFNFELVLKHISSNESRGLTFI